MLYLILFLIAGSALAYVSNENLMLVTLNLGPYSFSDIPLFYVIIGSLLTGLIFAMVVHSFYDIANSLKLRSKKNEIKQNKDEVLALTKRVHQLELENEKLKNGSRKEPLDPHGL